MRQTKLVLAFIAIFFPALLFAQPVVKSVLPIKVDLGLKFGANFSSIKGDEWQTKNNLGFHGGAFVGIRRNKIGAQGEVLFSQVQYTGNGVKFYNAMKATSNTNNNYNNPGDSTKNGSFAVTYLSIPVLFQYKIAGPIWIQLGPQFSSMIGVKDKDNLLKDAKQVFKSGDVSGIIGLQANIVGLRIGARYNLGFSDVSVSSVSNAWKQRTIQLYLGWSFL